MTAPLTWIRRIANELPELNTIPLFGNSPPFDWEQFSSSLVSRFGVSKFSIHPADQMWRESSDLKKGIDSEVHTLAISIAPIGTVYWIMSEEDRIKLISWMMRSSNKARPPLSEIFQEGFYRFAALHTLDIMQEMSPFTDLTLQISNEEEGFEKAFCIDIEMEMEEKSCWGRLALPAAFRAHWMQHFSHMTSGYFPQEVARQTQLELYLKTGSVILHQDDWQTIRKGDFILLDQGSYDPRKGTGVSLLMLGATPLFNSKIGKGKVELIDYAFYYEDNMEKRGEPSSQDAQPAEGEIVAIKEMPLYVTIEIARLKMTLDKLMQLTPGNTLELPVHPDQGVSLTINGQIVGRGELVYLGEQLGVRILEI